MSINFVEAYLTQKTKAITKYAKIMLKSVYQAKSDNTKTIEKCIDTYFKYFVLNENMNIENRNEFCVKNKITDDFQQEIIAIIFETITLLKNKVIDTEYTNNIILLSQILASSIKLDEYTNSLIKANMSSSEAIDLLEQNYGLFSDKNVWSNIKEAKQDLKDVVNNQFKTTKKIITALKKDPFHFNHYQIYDTPKTANIFIEAELDFEKSQLQPFDPKRIKESYENSDLPDKHTLIMVDKTIILLMLSRMNGRRNETYFIRLNDNFFGKKANVKKLLNMTKMNGLKAKISLIINGVQLEKYADQIKQLSVDNYGIALDDMPYLEKNVGNVRLIAKYLYIDTLFLARRHEIEPISEENHITLIDIGIKKEAILIDI